jgi:hypothetical protein
MMDITQFKLNLNQMDDLNNKLPEQDIGEVHRYSSFGEIKLVVEMLSEFFSERDVAVQRTPSSGYGNFATTGIFVSARESSVRECVY